MALKPKLLKQISFFKCPSFTYLPLCLHWYIICMWMCTCVLMHLCPRTCLCVCVCVCVCLCVCVCVCVCIFGSQKSHGEWFILNTDACAGGDFFFFLLKVSTEAVKRYRSEHITSPKGLLRGSHFMCQTPLFQGKYLTCFVTWLNLHVFRSGLLLSEALCCEMKITGICLPNAVIQRIVN